MNKTRETAEYVEVLYESEDGKVGLVMYDNSKMYELHGEAAYAKHGADLVLSTGENGRTPTDFKVVPERMFGFRIPGYERRLKKAADKMLELAKEKEEKFR